MSSGFGLIGLAWRIGVSGLVCAGVAWAGWQGGLTGAAAAAPGQAAAITIEVLLDNSPSMEIGATPGDVAALMHLTPCSVPGAVRSAGRANSYYGGLAASGQVYANYDCGDDRDATRQRRRFSGLACPIPAGRGVAGHAAMKPALIGPGCVYSLLASGAGPQQPTTAGAPCAFACHWDTRTPINAASDYYGLARSTVGLPPCYETHASLDGCGITLRFDLVKNAVARLVNTMQEDNFRGLANFSVGVFTFDTALHAVYPVAADCGARGQADCAAGQDWARALGAIGTAPALPDMPDTGIQPISANNGPGSTDLPQALTALATDYLRNGSGGRTMKALFLVTDGLDDHSGRDGRHFGAVDPGLCQAYKAMGYRVYVLYTPYVPLMNGFYLAHIARFAEGDGPGSLEYNLRRCASGPENFIAARFDDPGSVSRGLQVLLRQVLAGH